MLARTREIGAGDWGKRLGILISILLAIALAGARAHAADVLMVYGTGKLKQGDDRVADRLLKNGYSVTLKSDQEVGTDDAAGKDLVLICDSVNDDLLGSMFRDVQVPVLCLENKQMDNLGLTQLILGTDFGAASDRQTIKITNPDHTLAANLHGSVQVSSKGAPLGWGVPGENAIKVGLLGGATAESGDAGSQQRYVLFEYEVGTQMPGLVAPAKRIGLLLSTKATAHVTQDGEKLLDAAVDHAVRASTGGCAPCQSGEHQVTLVNKSADTIWVGVWDFWKGRGIAPPASDCFKDWELTPGAKKTYCAPYGANNRFFPRGGCKDASGNWKSVCDTNDCNYPMTSPAQATCSNGGLVSLAEINFDSNGAWYDVSYVDGYTYPVTVTVDNADGCKSLKAGCGSSLGACPWSTRDSKGRLGGSICYGGCKEVDYRRKYDNLPTPPTSAQLTAVCCTCPDNTSGCDDTRCDDVGCGCSPHAAYDPYRSARTCCSPIPDLEVDPVNPCATDGHCTWPFEYTKYPRQIKTSCDNSYGWQFHDSAGLMHCTAGTQPYNYTVTFWPKS